MFGPHLIIDCYGCKKEKIGNVEFIKRFLDMLPEALGLHKISEASVNFYDIPTPGISGFVLISESHISVHTFVEEGFAAVDIFSCKEFDIEKATEAISNTFEPKKYDKKFVYRGKHYPVEIRKAIQMNINERKKKTLN